MYSVTILNDASLLDKQGAIHTWLKINKINVGPFYFSFSNSDTLSLIGFDSKGKSSVNADLKERNPTEQHQIIINEEQYNRLIKESNDFYKEHPNYDLTPDAEGDYNCVTASRRILESAGIDYLKNVQTPYGVECIISGCLSNLESLLSSKDDFDRHSTEVIAYFLHKERTTNTLTKMYFNPNRPLAIPWGATNADYANYYLFFGGRNTALHDAAKFSYAVIGKYLIEQEHIDVDGVNAAGATALHVAARFGHLDMITYLIDTRHAIYSRKTNTGMTALHFAALGGHLEAARFLIRKYIETGSTFTVDDHHNASPLHYAASSGNLALVQLLIENGATVNNPVGSAPLDYAVSSGGNLKIVKFLIEEKNAKIEETGTPTLHLAALGGHLNIVRYLCNERAARADVVGHEIHTIHFAVRGKNVDIVRFLIEEKQADINAKDNVNGTPLHDAAQRGLFDIVKYLLSKGASVDVRNKLGETPMDCAIRGRFTRVVGCLQSVSKCIDGATSRRGRSLIGIYPGSPRMTDFGFGRSHDHGASLGSVHWPNQIDTMDRSSQASTDLAKNEFVPGNAMLADLLIRKHTGIKYKRSLNGIESKEHFLAEKLEEAETNLNATLSSKVF